MPFQTRFFIGNVVQPVPFFVVSQEGRHIEIAPGDGADLAFPEVVMIEVKVGVPFADQDETLPVGKVGDRVVRCLGNVFLVGFLVHHQGFTGGGIGMKDVEPVLQPVQPQDGEHVRVGSPLDPGDVLVRFRSHIHGEGPAGFEVIHMDADDGVFFPRFGVFEGMGLRVQVPEQGHVKLADSGLIEPVESDLAAVGRPVKSPGEAEFFLVHPVRGAVDDLILLSIVGDPDLRAFGRIRQKEVVVPHKGHPGALRGELRQLLLAMGRHGPELTARPVVDPGSCPVGTAVDPLHLRLQKNQGFVLIELVAVEGFNFIEQTGIEQGFHVFSCLVGILLDFLVPPDGVVDAVVHGGETAQAPGLEL
ncbi:MAG: hypothetical protein R2751_15540 [Bacteroidales bacterium]